MHKKAAPCWTNGHPFQYIYGLGSRQSSGPKSSVGITMVTDVDFVDDVRTLAESLEAVVLILEALE